MPEPAVSRLLGADCVGGPPRSRWALLRLRIRRWASLTFLDLGDGLRYGYPVCCVVRFSFGRGEQAVKRGICHADSDPYVPCGIFHHGEDYEDACRKALASW